MNLKVQCCIHKDYPIIPNLNRSKVIPHIGTYFFKIYSNVVHTPTRRPSWRSLSCRFTSKNFETILKSSILANNNNNNNPMAQQSIESRVSQRNTGLMSTCPQTEVRAPVVMCGQHDEVPCLWLY